ncbi:hypothetical protein EI555_002595 [Monodon monoceros]|uniref:Uncharacterized protein n=1 Tax=Monodon monoceros TaxID=40151 RepID=A0A4V5P6P7_MONMO|nr:hypothetical protein EI555_002595 [Monodon monoceros]
MIMVPWGLTLMHKSCSCTIVNIVNCVNNLNATKEKYKETLIKDDVIIQGQTSALMMLENPKGSGWKLVQIGVGLVSLSYKDTYKLLPVLIRIHYKEEQVFSTLGDWYGSMLTTFSIKVSDLII